MYDSVLMGGSAAVIAWVIIMILSTGGDKEERNDIRSDGTNVLLSGVGYCVALYGCLYFKTLSISWIAVILLGLLALIPFAAAVIIAVKHAGSVRRILSAFISSIVPLFIVGLLFVNCILK